MPLFPLLWLFFCYSFLGWVLETAVSAVRLHRYVDRSVLFGPLCACYGITAVLLTVGLPELRGNYFFLFLGSAICSTVVEWIAGHLLEKATHTRWWDYSNRRGNLDGYICVGAFLLWGVLGLAAVQRLFCVYMIMTLRQRLREMWARLPGICQFTSIISHSAM